MSIPATAGPVAPTAPPGPVALPPAGPAWFGVVMGTGILAATLPLVAGDGVPVLAARGLLVLAWGLLVGLTVATTVRFVRVPGAFCDSLRHPAAVAPLWGLVAMALVSVGSATAAVLPGWVPAATGAARGADAVLWVLGTAVGLATALAFARRLRRRELGTPTTVAGLAVVPPMVSATVGAGLVPLLPTPWRPALLVLLAGCFLLALTLGLVAFARAYHHHWRVAPLPSAASVSAWIPLGIVGQSTAAAQTIVAQAVPNLAPGVGEQLRRAAVGYGVVALAVAVPLVVWAVGVTVRGFRRQMPWSPGWWALTFPVGTLVLGAHRLGEAGPAAYAVVAQVALAVLVGTWTLCAVTMVRALRSQPGSAR